MSNELAFKNTAVITGNAFNFTLVEGYINYIDRSQKTVTSYLKNLKQFFAYLSFKGIRQPIREDIITYRDYLLSRHEALKFTSLGSYDFQRDKTGAIKTLSCSSNTVKSYLQSIKSFFKYLSLAGLYPNIAENIHAPKVNNSIHKKDALGVRDIIKIENSITQSCVTSKEEASTAIKDAKGKAKRADEQGKRLKAMYLLAVNAGLRTIEISRANIKDLCESNGQAFIYIWGKGHSEADAKKALASEVYQAIKEYLAVREDTTSSSPLFVATGNRSKNKRLASTTISTMLKKAMIKAGFNSSRLTAHSLRHSTATVLQEMDGDIYETQKYMRHSSPSTTEIYLHDEDNRAEQATAQRLYNFTHEKQALNIFEKLASLKEKELLKLFEVAKLLYKLN